MSTSRCATRLIFGLALLALVAACSSFTRFGYNQADTLAAWVADDYFELEPLQKEEFQKRFARIYIWHRHDQLPEYATFLQTAKGRLQKGISRDDVLWFMDGVRARTRTATRQAAPDTATFLATLTPEQIENMKRHWAKDNRKYLKERKLDGTVAERFEGDAKRMTKHFKDWLTPLNAEQEQLVATLTRELPEMHQLHYADRLRRQKDFLELLSHRAEGERFNQRVTEFIVNWERGRTPEYQKRLDAWWQKRADMFVALDRTLTPQQRTAAVDRLQGYANDFVALAQRADSRRATAER